MTWVSPTSRTSKTKASLVVASVLALIIVLAKFMMPEEEPAPVPPPPVVVVEPAPPPPPPTPDAAVLEAVALQIGVADSARIANEFDLALATLLSAESALSPVKLEFASDSVVVRLGDTIARLLTETKSQCDVVRDLRLRLSGGQPAPECKVE